MKHNAKTGDLFDFIDLDKKLTEAHYNRAFGYLRLGELELATKAAQTALKINQDYPPVLSLLDLIKQEYFVSGLTSVRENRIQDGIRAFQSAVDIDPAFTDAYYEIGRAYLRQDELEDAENTAKKILRLNSGSESAHELLERIKRVYSKRARTCFKQCKFTSAKKAIDELLRLDSDYELAHELLESIKCAYYDQGVVFLGQERYNKAITNFKNALAIDACFTKAYCGLANVYLELGELGSAEKIVKDLSGFNSDCESARELSEKIKDAYYDRVCVSLKHDKFKDAGKAIKEVLRLDSNSKLLLKIKSVYCDRGQAYLSQGKFEFAEKIVKEVLGLDSSCDAAHQLLEKIKHSYCDRGVSLLKRSQCEEAIPSFKKALVIDPCFTNAYCGIAGAYLGQGKFAAAEKAIREIFRLDPSSSLLEDIMRTYYDYGRMWLRQSKLVDAEKAVKEVLRLDPSYEPACKLLKDVKFAYYDRGRVYLDQGKLENAEKAISDVLRLDSRYKPACKLLKDVKHVYQARGTIFLNEKQSEEANSDFQRAAAIDAEFTETGLLKAYCQLGDFYLRRSDLDKAHAAIAEGLRLDLSYEPACELLEQLKHVYCNHGRMYLDRGKLENAEKAISDVLRLDLSYEPACELLEQLKHAYYDRVLRSLSEDQYNVAITSFGRLLAIDPDFAEIRWGDALTHLGQDNLVAAEKTVRELLDLDSDSWFYYSDWWFYQFDSDYEFDSNYWSDPNASFAAALLGKIKYAYYDQGITFLKENQYNAAIINFENAIGIDMSFTEAYSRLQDAYLGFGYVYLGQLDVTEESANQLATQLAYLTGKTEFTENTHGLDDHGVFGSSLPADTVVNMNRFDAVYEVLCQELQREPLLVEIADALGLTEREVEEILMLNSDTISIDSLITDGCFTETLGNLI